MKDARPRRFTLLDAMALVVAVAIGLAIARGFGNFSTIRREVQVSFWVDSRSTSTIGVNTSDYMNRATAASFRPPIKGEIIYWGKQLSFWPGPCMAALSLATLGLGFRRAPRPARRAGTVMAVAVTVAMAAAAVRLPHLLILKPGPTSPLQLHWREWWLEFWFTLPRLAGFAVLVSWVSLAVGGRWRAGGGWLDRLAVLLGAVWIGMAMLGLGTTWYYALPSY